MITITLPDKQQKTFPLPPTAMAVVESIGPRLAKAALAAKVNGRLVDMCETIPQDADFSVVKAEDPEGLEVLRHSTAHLLAQAVKRLFPEAQVTIGPVIDNGFYYDFAYHRPFTPEDLVLIEQVMQDLVKESLPVTRQIMPRDEAITYFEKLGEQYKAQIIRDIPQGENISLYTQGEFTDLCRGPHVPNTGLLRAFKLTKVAGAYWRGDAKNAMLQRIYGTAWSSDKELKNYLFRLEEAEKRDHRKIGKQLDLFHLQEEAPGMVFWHPKGWAIYQTIQRYLRQKLRRHGYQEVNTPVLVDRSLWVASGHVEKFDSGMFATESENRTYLVKPMNCPCHVQIFKQGLKSYRDLPLRLAEFGTCHRNEPSGALHGLMRVRGFVQDDAHIFCTEGQVQTEAEKFIALLYEVYREFGFTDVLVKLSTRPAKRVGEDAAWDRAEKALTDALNAYGMSWQLQPGEGAFYGPKVEFALRDSIDRVWQCGTLQLDFFIPGRLGAEYVDEGGERKTPVMLHRAILGSLERFIGILIEHHAGLLPTWLSPTQAVVLNITDRQADYAESIFTALEAAGVRAQLDLRNEKIGFKIREHTLQRVPYLLIVGDKEAASGLVTVRERDGTDRGAVTLEQFLEENDLLALKSASG